jgi:hypothetical protein
MLDATEDVASAETETRAGTPAGSMMMMRVEVAVRPTGSVAT